MGGWRCCSGEFISFIVFVASVVSYCFLPRDMGRPDGSMKKREGLRDCHGRMAKLRVYMSVRIVSNINPANSALV